VIALDIELPLSRFPLRVAAKLGHHAVAILGPSGAGKTSLLETIAGLRRKASGRIAIDGEVLMDTATGVFLPPERRRIGYVPQDACLFPHLDVRGNVRFGMSRGSRDALFDEAVSILEIAPLLDRFPATLSGGERQRVALARAIATQPRLLLLDEPLAAVDVELKERILPYLLRVEETMRTPLLYVTHNAGEAEAVAEEALLLREGTVVLQGPAAAVLRSTTLSTVDPDTRFENILAGVVEPAEGPAETAVLRVGSTRLIVPAAAATPARARTIYAVSPEDIIVSTRAPENISARNVLRGTVVSEQGSQAGVWIRVAAGGLDWTVRLTRSAAEQLRLLPGTTAWLVLKTHAFRRLR
jgi:molybdate transport system ATP-binding protein